MGACLVLGACRFPGTGKAPSGQVLASVNGQEITMRDLHAELNGVAPSDPRQLKAVEQQALQIMINRKLLAKAAEAEKLEKTPDFALKKQRAIETLMAQTLQDSLVASVPTPTNEEVVAFMAAHPDIFAQRKIFTVEQIQARGPMSQATLQSFTPLKTLDEVEATLVRNNVSLLRGKVTLDAVGLDPRLVDMLVKLKPDDVYIIPQGAAVQFGEIRDTKVQPFQGKAASDYASQLLHQQRIQQAVTRKMQGVIAQGAAKVSYNPAYRPAAPAKATPPAKGG